MSHIWMIMSHVCRTYEWDMLHMWMSHVARMNHSCCAYEWAMAHIWMNHVAHVNETCHTYEWVMSHIKMSHVAHMNESYHIYKPVMLYVPGVAQGWFFNKCGQASEAHTSPWQTDAVYAAPRATCSSRTVEGVADCVCAYMCVCICVYVCVCICVCVQMLFTLRPEPFALLELPNE